MVPRSRPQKHCDSRRARLVSSWIADALESRPGYEGLHELIRYALNRLQVESLEDPTWSTFECVVNGSEAMSWLRDNRPDVASMIHADAAAPAIENTSEGHCFPIGLSGKLGTGDSGLSY